MSVAQTARRNLSFGGRVPPLVGALLAITVIVSIADAISTQAGVSLAAHGALIPEAVMRGEIWRLATWVFFEGSPISLVFGCLMLYWFGRDLAAQWGDRWFAWAWFGGSVATGVIITLVGRFAWAAVLHAPFAGNAAITAGLVLVWALAFPERQIRLYFLFPMGGMTLVWIELGITALVAIYSGLGSVLPVVIGEAVALAYMFRGRLTRRLRALAPSKKPPRKAPTSFQVWDDDKQRFRPPKWMN